MSELDPELSRRYRDVATETPSPALDAAILAAARQQAARPKRRERPRWSRWMVPASVMATLVLGVSITLMIEREHPETVAPGHRDAEQVTIPPAATPAPAQNKLEAERVFADKPTMAPAEHDQRGRRQELPAVSGAEVRPPAVDGGMKDMDAIQFKGDGKAKAISPAPVDTGRSDPVAAEAAPTRLRSRIAEPSVAPESKTAADAATSDNARGALGAAAPARQAGNKLPAVPRSPEAWIEDIRRLKQAGRVDEAAEQLAELRKAYPAFVLPADLGK